MAKTCATFKQADLVRAVKAARAAGLEIARTEIAPDGRIILVHHAEEADAQSAFDAWKGQRNARSS